jgi:hypothetical protein
MWALLLVAGPGALAQEPAAGTAQAAAVQRQPGKRLRLELKETRERDGSPTSTRASALLLHADAGPARLFVGAQLVITVSEREATTNIFKNAGMTLEARLAAQPDGRYLASVRFEESRRRRMPEPVDAPVAGRNPILQVVKGESRLSLREGETLPLATAVDPVTGEVVRLELGLAATAAAGAARTASPGVPVRARLVLVRRQGSTMLVRRPYTLVLHPGGDEGAEVFSGSMLPVQVRMNNQITVALKDVGAGLKLKAHSTEDGHRLEVQFSDGVLSPGEDGPQVRVFESESQLLVQEGETLTLASAVDPVTGEVVEAELTLEAVR